MITVLLIIALLIAIIAVIFALQNTAMVTVAFFAWQFEQSLALVLLITVIVGVIIGVLTVLPGTIRNRWRLSGQKKKLDALDKKLKEEVRKREDLETQVLALQSPPPAKPESPAPAGETAGPVEPLPAGPAG